MDHTLLTHNALPMASTRQMAASMAKIQKMRRSSRFSSVLRFECTPVEFIMICRQQGPTDLFILTWAAVAHPKWRRRPAKFPKGHIICTPARKTIEA